MTDPVAILANALYVPERLVQPHHLHPYTYEIETQQTVQQTHLPPICENCDRWGKKWRQGGLTCADKNYGLLDSCHLFAHKIEREKVVTEVLTYSKEGEYYVFPRGDLGKIERTFHGIPIHDMRSAPPLGFDLTLKYTLRPDQQEVFDAWMRHGYGIVNAPTGWGKCCRGDTLVSTSRGLVQIQHLVRHRKDDHAEPVSDLRVVATGYDQPVSHTYYQERKPTLRVVTERGYEVTGTHVHPLQVLDPNKGLMWKTLAEMAVGDFVAVRPFPLHGTPVRIQPLMSDLSIHWNSSDVTFPDTITPDLAELLGSLTADGTLRRGYSGYTKSDPVLVQRIYSLFSMLGLTPRAEDELTHSVKSVVFSDVIERLGVSLTTAAHKVIPWSCMQSGAEVAAGFLRGLFSGDSYLEWGKRTLDYTTASKELATTLQVLLLGFGIVTTLRTKSVVPPGHTEPRDYYVVIITRLFLDKFQAAIGFVPGCEKDIKLTALLALGITAGSISSQQLRRYPVNNIMRRVYKRHGLTLGARDLNLEQCLAARATPPGPQQLHDFLYHLCTNKLDVCPDIDVENLYDVSELADHGVVFTPVERIEDAGEQEVFDLSVPGTEWFVGNGIVNHNTVLMSALFAAMKVRILVLTDKLRHLQVVEEGLREATNLNDLEKEYGTTLCGVLGEEVRYRKDGKKYVSEKPGLVYPITLSTYQSLTSARGRTLLPHLQNYFGCVWHEEGHHEAAETYHYVTKSLNPYYRGGQTATPTRGDQMHMVLYDTVGPVTAKSTTPAWTPKATFINTGVHVPDSCFRGMYALVNVETWLSRERAYFDHVRDAVLEDLQNGRKVLVYSKRVAFNHKLRQTLHMAGYGAESIDGKSKPKEQAWYTQQILDGKLDVIIGTSVIAENYNIPPLDCLHLPFTNFTEETEKQIVGRILRSNVENKPQPLIRVYTWTANQSVAKTAAHWRRQLYKKLRYEIEPDRNLGGSILNALED